MLKTEVIQKALIINGDEVLLVRRSDTVTRRPLQWDLPGGMLEPGEALEDCVKREIKEETGLDVKNVRLIYTKTEARKWDKGQANAVFLFYVGKTDKKEIVLSFEHDKYKWVKLSEASKEFEYYLQRDFIEYVVDNQLEL